MTSRQTRKESLSLGAEESRMLTELAAAMSCNRSKAACLAIRGAHKQVMQISPNQPDPYHTPQNTSK